MTPVPRPRVMAVAAGMSLAGGVATNIAHGTWLGLISAIGWPLLGSGLYRSWYGQRDQRRTCACQFAWRPQRDPLPPMPPLSWPQDE